MILLKNHAWRNDSFKEQSRPMNFNVIEYRKVTDKVSNFTLQLTFKKVPLVELWYSIKDNPHLSQRAIKISLRFPTAYLWEARFSSHASTKTAYYNRLNAETDLRIQLSSINFWKKFAILYHVASHFTNFCFRKYSYFLKVLFRLTCRKCIVIFDEYFKLLSFNFYYSAYQ